jgi:succinate dehydrogenase/fumarate reductase flavoprotein subunit
MGYEAGKEAAKFSRRNGARRRIQDQELDAEQERLFSAYGAAGNLSPADYEEKIRNVVTDYVGYQRTEEKLRSAVDRLRNLALEEAGLRARDGHELMRAHEARNIREVAEMVATAALERRESRGSYSHYRADFPSRDDANWRKMIVLKKGESGYEVGYRATGVENPPEEKRDADIDQ